MSALITHGYASPQVAGAGGGGGSGASGTIIPFLLYDVEGVLTSAIDLSAGGVVKISVDGADFVNAVGAAPVTVAGRTGTYYYELDDAEIGDCVVMYVVKAGYHPVVETYRRYALKSDVTTSTTTTAGNIANAVSSIDSSIATSETSINDSIVSLGESVPTVEEIDIQLSDSHGEGSWAGDTAADILETILSFELRSGRTIRGHLRRMDALFFGKVTGMLGALVRAWRPGLSAVEFEVVQDPTAGTRAEVDVTDSEVP